MIASAFLDRFDRYAKTEDAVHHVALFFGDESPPRREDLDLDEYDALTVEEQTTIKEAPSAARFIDTTGKSNA